MEYGFVQFFKYFEVFIKVAGCINVLIVPCINQRACERFLTFIYRLVIFTRYGILVAVLNQKISIVVAVAAHIVPASFATLLEGFSLKIHVLHVEKTYCVWLVQLLYDMIGAKLPYLTLYVIKINL